MIASSAGRVPSNTSLDANLAIKKDFRSCIAYYSDHPHEIPRRLRQLDQEWDIERALGLASSTLTLAGLGLGLSGRRRGFFLSLVVQGFFLQHTLQGWCPPVPVLRSLGYRTAWEIERERSALKEMLRERRPGGDAYDASDLGERTRNREVMH